MKFPRFLGSVTVLIALASTACGTDSPTSSEFDAAAGVGNRDGGASSSRSYEITIYNFTSGQPFTPPLVATHQGAIDLFEVGMAASFGIKEIAENGNLAPLQTELEAAKHVSDVVVAVAGTPPPVMPGQSVTVTLDAEPGARFLSFVAMLICTNDGFTGADGLRLPSGIGESYSADLAAYDAGTEINTEDFTNLVPPCPALTGIAGAPPGSGMSEPALAENGVVAHHPGIAGTADLQVGLHGWTEPVGRVSITRVN